MRHLFAPLLLLAPLVAGSVGITWNAQWPELCPQQHVPADALSRFGVHANKGNAFNGDVVSTLYNHPGSFTIGDWPCIGSGVIYNGGIPQKGNMSAHLSKVSEDVNRLFPDKDHTGIVAIDWEEWQPWLKFWNDPAPTARWNAYANASFALAGGNKAAAIASWNTSSLDFMVRTLETCKAMRPKALWGFYGMVGCDGQYDLPAQPSGGIGSCSAEIQARNDALAPLWAAGTALFPSVYSTCQYDPTAQPEACEKNSSLAQKIPTALAEVQRVNRAKLPVVPFTWFDLYTQHCAKSPPAGLGHCPLMKSPEDLDTEFARALKFPGVDGLIVWGSHGDVRPNTTDCLDFTEYWYTTLGPFLETIQNKSGQIS